LQHASTPQQNLSFLLLFILVVKKDMALELNFLNTVIYEKSKKELMSSGISGAL
jgi:hypothetical protein